MYNPDRWVIVKITNKKETIYKVLAGWSGGYLDGQSWRMNSGISRVESTETHYMFSGQSGNVYNCHKNAYGVNMIMSSIIAQMKEVPEYAVEVLEDQDFTQLLK